MCQGLHQTNQGNGCTTNEVLGYRDFSRDPQGHGTPDSYYGSGMAVVWVAGGPLSLGVPRISLDLGGGGGSQGGWAPRTDLDTWVVHNTW